MQLLEIIGLIFCQAHNQQTMIVYLTSDSSETGGASAKRWGGDGFDFWPNPS